MANEVWCLTVDHEKNPIGAPLPLFLENETNIAALRRKVKEAKPNALKYVNPNELMVWRHQSQGFLPPIDSVYPELLKEQVKHFFSDKHCLRQLDGGQTIKGLNIKSEETLMVQLPNNKKHRNDAEAETGNPSRDFQDLVIDLYTQCKIEC